MSPLISEVSGPTEMTDTETTAPVRVLFMIDNLGYAGTEQWLLRLIDNLDRSRVAPFLCLLDGSHQESKDLEPANVPILRLCVKSLRSLAALTASRRFTRLLKAEKIEIVQLHFPDSIYFGAPLAWWAGMKRIIGTNRNTGYWTTPMHRRRSRFVARYLTDMIANSRASLDAAKDIFPSKKIRMTVIYNGVDLNRFKDLPALRIAKPVNEKWRVGIVANLRPVKDLPTFIRAAREVLKTIPDVEFLIAGEGPDRSSLEQLISSLGLKDDIRLLGAVTDIPAFLGRLDVAVLCSKSEGCSNSLIEYFAARRPVVATAVGGNTELIESGRDGLLCSSGDFIALANSIRNVLNDRSFASTLASSGNRKCEANFSKRRELEHYTSLVLGLTN